MEGVWEDEDDLPQFSNIDREWRIQYDRLFQEGFRSGIDNGMEDQMQDGFDDGFRLGAFMGKRLGYAEGALKVAATVSPQDAEAADGAIAALTSKGHGEATAVCKQELSSSAKPAPPTTPAIGSGNALTHAEDLCVRLGYPKCGIGTCDGPDFIA